MATGSGLASIEQVCPHLWQPHSTTCSSAMFTMISKSWIDASATDRVAIGHGLQWAPSALRRCVVAMCWQ